MLARYIYSEIFEGKKVTLVILLINFNNLTTVLDVNVICKQYIKVFIQDFTQVFFVFLNCEWFNSFSHSYHN